MNNKGSSGVVIPVPIVYFTFILVGVWLDYFWPFSFFPHFAHKPIGYTIIVSSFVLFGLVLREFSRSNTSIDHKNPTTEIITTGPFRYSRNPVYVSLTMLAIGVAVLVDTLWVIIMTVPPILFIHYAVILKEEAYLFGKFGDEYRQYMKSVRRWV